MALRNAKILASLMVCGLEVFAVQLRRSEDEVALEEKRDYQKQ
jgi:hypothetical protein